MAKPLVAVVGRPNVGKSTFFNKMIGKRISIVEDTPGVTRDRIYGDVEWLGKTFTLIDTGGLDITTEDVILTQMRRQAQVAIDTADLILFMVDGREGVTAADREVAQFLRRSKKPVLLAVNKLDHPKHINDAAEFYEFGMGEPHVISALNMLGLGDLCDEIIANLPKFDLEEEEEQSAIRIAFVGRPNVGKSSLVNRLLGDERMIVTDIPGTTRDAIDTPLEHNGSRFILIDTAGIRKKAKIEDESLERYSVLRALTAIRRADVAVLVIDAADEVTEQDTKIAGIIADEGRACVILVNKWDTVDKDTGTYEKTKLRILSSLKFMDWARVEMISALTGQRAHSVLDHARDAYAEFGRRITTGILNDALADMTATTPPPTESGRRLKLLFITQESVKPPTFILFVNDEKLMHFGYKRHLENELRKTFGFDGTPIRLFIRSRKEEST